MPQTVPASLTTALAMLAASIWSEEEQRTALALAFEIFDPMPTVPAHELSNRILSETINTNSDLFSIVTSGCITTFRMPTNLPAIPGSCLIPSPFGNRASYPLPQSTIRCLHLSRGFYP